METPHDNTQESLVLQHLNQFGSIEPLTALCEYICYHLGAVIFKLRAKGYDIITERITSKSRITVRTVNFAKYILHS